MTTNADDARLAKLPAWARAEIEHLRRDVDYWTKRATAGPEDSDTFLYADPRWERHAENRPLGKGESVYFVAEPDGRTFSARIDEKGLHVSAHGDSVSNPLLVVPMASNSVTIR